MLNTAPRLVLRRSLRLNSRRAIVLASCLGGWVLLAQVRPANAQVDYTWNVAGPAEWNTAANWTPAGGPPGTAAGDNAHIGMGGTAVIDTAGGAVATVDSVLFDDVLGGTVNQSDQTLALAGTEVAADPAGPGRLRIGAVNANAFGTYNLTGTGIVTASRIQVGETGGGAAPVSTFNQGVIGDAGTTSVTTTGSLNIGGAGGGTVGNGVYTLNSGTLTVGSDGTRSLSIGNNVGSVGVLNIKDGTLVSQSAQIGNGGTGTVNQTGGTTTFNQGPGNWFALGGSTNGASGGAGTGTYNLSGGTMTVNNWLFLGNNNGGPGGTSTGTFNISGNASLNSSWIVPGNDTTGIFNQSGNSTVTFSSRILIGGQDAGTGATAQGTYNMMGGTLTGLASTNFNVGQNGTGVFNQTGGTVNHDGFPLTIGATNNATSNGTYNLSGNGILNVATNGGTNGGTDFYIANGNSSTGLLNQMGGTITQAAGRFQIGSGTGSTGTYRISGGTATFGNTWVGQGNGATALIQQSGGTVNFGGDNGLVLGWGGDGASSSTYNLSGPTSGANATVMNAGTLPGGNPGLQIAWNGNATVNQNGGVVNALRAGVSFRNGTGVYNLSGGILNTASVVKAGTGNATFNFNGGTLSPTASAANFLQGLNTANVQAGGAVFDTNGNTITVAQNLLNGVAGTDGGLTLTDSNAAATGNLTLTGANTYNGTTRVISSAGALGPSTLFLGNALAVQNSTVQMTAGLNNSVQFVGGIGAFTFGGLTGSANLSLTDVGATPVTLSVGNNNTETTYTGVLGTAADGANLIKIGSGTLHLTKTQLYTGTTTINGGTLSLNGAGASLANSSSVDVGGAAASGTPMLLAQGGANAGNVHVLGAEITGVAGTIAAGDINTFSATSLKLDTGANATFVLGTSGVGGAGVTADLIAVTNALTLPAAGSAVVNLTDNLDAGGAGHFGVGTYKLFTEGSTVNFASTKLSIGVGIPGFQESFSNPGGTEIDLVVTAAPTWKAVAADTNWNNGANWVNGLIPGVHDGTTTNTDLADFTTTSNFNPAVDLNRNLQNITFDQAAAGAYVIAGPNALLLTAGGTIQTTAKITKSETINAPLVLEGASGAYAFSSNAASSSNVLIIGGGITGGAAGNTVLTLTGGNTGSNTVSGVIGDGAATLALVKSGAGTWVLNKTEANTGGTTILAGTLQLGDGSGNGSVIGPIVDGGSLRVANPNPQTIANAISGGGTLTAAGASLLTLTNSNSVSGLTTINGGSSLQLGDGVANNGSVGGNILDNGSLTFANPTDLAYAGAIGGSGAVTMSGPGTLTLSGTSTYLGTTTISANVTLTSAVAANILPSATPVTMNGAATLDITGVVSDQTIGSLSSASAATSVNLGANNLITGGNGNSTAFAGSIGGTTGGLVKNGGGTFTLSNANTYSGGTQINAGAVQLNNANAAQNSTVTVGAANGLKFGSGLNTFNIGGLAGGSNFSLTDTGSVAVTLNAGLNGADTAYSGILSGAGGVLGKVGTGTLTVSGNNTYSGGTVVSAGTLSATTLNTALGAGPVTLAGGRLQLTGGVKNAIGINFEGGTGLAPTLLLATDTAGVFPHANWNNVNSNGVGAPPAGPPGSNTNIDGPIALSIVDKNGVATAMTISFLSDHPDAVSSGAPLTTGNVKLMNGYLGVNQFNSPNGTHADVTLSNVPFPQYDAYVYFGSRNEFGGTTTLHVTVDTTAVYGTTSDNPFTGFVQATGVDAASANPSDYALFPLLGDATLAVSLQVDQTREAGIHGIQIVEAANPSLAYANNVVVTSDSTIDVSGPASATLGTLSIGSNTLSVTGASFAMDQPYTLNLGAASVSGVGTTTFDVANNGLGTGTLRVASLTTGGAGRTITKANAGTMEIQGASTINGGSNINVTGGTLRFNNTSGPASVGAGVSATVASGATLELAGTFSGLSDPSAASHRAHIINNSTQASGGSLLVSGTNQQVGAIDGIGDTVVNAGGSLTANHIIQNALVIGGAGASAGTVTIAASDASGNSLADSGGFALAGSLTPSAGFGAGTLSSSSLSASSGSAASGSSLSGSGFAGSVSSVPEPSTLLLLALGSLACGLGTWRRRKVNLEL